METSGNTTEPGCTTETGRPQSDGKALRPVIKRGRVSINLAANLANFAFGLFVGLWFTPYLIRNLGTASYGLISLVNQITGYLAVATVLSSSVVGRYVTIALERLDHDEANLYFNTALFGNVCIVLLLLVPAILAGWNLEHLIVLPPGQEMQVRWLFACTVAGFFGTTIRSAFNVAIFYTNRLHLQTAIGAIQQTARVALVVGLFSLLRAEIWQVGLATLLSMCIGWGWSIRLWRRLTPMLRLSFACFQRSALRPLLSTGGWLSVNQMGAILFLAIDLVVVNRLFGPEQGGRYAVALQWSSLLRSVAAVIAGGFAPTMFYLYARNETTELVRYSRRAMKFLGLAMALPIGLICGLSEPLLKTWLGPKFADLAPLMSLLTIHLSVNLAVQPLFNVQTATNHVRWPAIMTLVMGAVNLGLAIYLAGPMGWGLYGVAAAGAIALTAKNLLFTPLYAAHVLRCGLRVFFRGMLPTVGATIGIAFVCQVISLAWHPSGWMQLAMAAFAVAAAYAASVYWIILSDHERVEIKCLLPRFQS